MPEHRTAEPVPAHRLAPAREVLGVVGAAELAMFSRLGKDAQHAPDLPGRVTLSRMAAAELASLDVVEQLAERRGLDFFDAVGTYQGLLVDFDRRTAPSDWWERLVKTYVGYGVILDLQRELARGLDEAAQEALADAVADNGHGDYVVGVLGPVLEYEPQLGARLALWGRRVVGEALAVAQRTLVVHPDLVPAPDAEEGAGRVVTRLAAAHADRLSRLGLKA